MPYGKLQVKWLPSMFMIKSHSLQAACSWGWRELAEEHDTAILQLIEVSRLPAKWSVVLSRPNLSIYSIFPRPLLDPSSRRGPISATSHSSSGVYSLNQG